MASDISRPSLWVAGSSGDDLLFTGIHTFFEVQSDSQINNNVRVTFDRLLGKNAVDDA